MTSELWLCPFSHVFMRLEVSGGDTHVPLLSQHVLLCIPCDLWLRRPCVLPVVLPTCRDVCNEGGDDSPCSVLPYVLTPRFISRCVVISLPRSVPKSCVPALARESENRRTDSGFP